MKVVHIINRLIGGGAEVMVPQIHNRHLQVGVDSWILSMETGDDRGTGKVVSFGGRHPRWQEPFRLRRALRRIEEEGPIDVVHTHLTQSQLFGKFAAGGVRHRPALITTEHAPSNRRRSLAIGRLFDRALYRGYDRVVCISEGVAESMGNWLPQLGRRLAVVPNGIEPAPFREARDRTPMPENRNVLRILSVGRLIPEKNFSLALRALADLRNRSWTYTIVGEGVCRREWENLAADLGIADRVRFAGYRNDIAAICAGHDLFVLPSLWEGFGLAAVEAMTAGLPVLASDVPGLADVVGKGAEAGGLLVPPDDEAAWADALARLMDQPEERARLARSAAARAEAYTMERCADRYLEIYREVLGERR